MVGAANLSPAACDANPLLSIQSSPSTHGLRDIRAAQSVSSTVVTEHGESSDARGVSSPPKPVESSGAEAHVVAAKPVASPARVVSSGAGPLPRLASPPQASRGWLVKWMAMCGGLVAVGVGSVLVVRWLPTREQSAVRWVVENGGVARCEIVPVASGSSGGAATPEAAARAAQPDADEEAVPAEVVSVSTRQAIPKPPFRIVAVDLTDQKFDEAGLVRLAGLKDVRSLDLSRTPVSDAGLKFIGTMTGLRMLKLRGTKVTGAGLKALEPLVELDDFTASGSKGIDDRGAAVLAKLPKLRIALLSGTTLTDKGLMEFAPAHAVFGRIGVARTNVTPAGIAAFQKERPGCRVDATDAKGKK